MHAKEGSMRRGRGGGPTHTNLSSSTPSGSPGGQRRRQTQERKKIAGLFLSRARVRSQPAPSEILRRDTFGFFSPFLGGCSSTQAGFE